MAKGIKVRGTEATIYEPTSAHPWWKIAYIDRVTGKRRTTSGGKTQGDAEDKARQLSGLFVQGYKSGDAAPTLQETVDSWLAANGSRWSSRTSDHYAYFAKKFTDLYGGRPINRIFPQDIAAVELADKSRGQQQRARTLVRGIFGHSANWLNNDKELIESLAKAITISGNASGKRNERVSKGDIPTSPVVAAFIITASHTLQAGPLKQWDELRRNLDSEDQRHGSYQPHVGLGLNTPLMSGFIDGLPATLTDEKRRGMPKHYRNPEARKLAETQELASRYRQVALATALGAGGGLRIGEVLALRVRHFLTPEQWTLAGTMDYKQGAILNRAITENKPQLLSVAFDGTTDVSEQASQASRGKIWITGTKGKSKSRTVHLPAFLPNWNGFGYGTHRDQIAAVIPRFQDQRIPLWASTEEESIELWSHGFTPLNYLLWQRFRELWIHPAIEHLEAGPRTILFRELLMFPTRNRARPGRDGRPNVLIDPGWKKSIAIVDGDGTYQAQSNFAKAANPVYDHVSEHFLSYPEHRTNSTSRKGWTHHGLRHYAVSSRILAGVPLPLIAEEMGHSDSAFTLARYGHVVDQGVGLGGFEY